MNIEQLVVQKSVTYMTPFISTIDILRGAYESYKIPVTKEEFSRRLNTLCFSNPDGLSFAVPMDDQIFTVTTCGIEIVKYEDPPAESNPMRISGTGISGGFKVNRITRLDLNRIKFLKQILQQIIHVFKEASSKTNIKDIKSVEELTTNELCRLLNAINILNAHVEILKMCIRYISPIHYYDSDNLVYVDLDASRSFEFYPSLLCGILMAADKSVFTNLSKLSIEDSYDMFIRAKVHAEKRKLNYAELGVCNKYVKDHNANEIILDRLRVIDLNTVQINVLESGFYIG